MHAKPTGRPVVSAGTTSRKTDEGGLALARRLLQGLQGMPLQTLTGRLNTILRVDHTSDEVLVATGRSPEGQPVPIAEVEQALGRLLTQGEVAVTPKELGYRSAFMGAVLRTLPGATVRLRPARVVLAATDGQDDDATAQGLLDAIAGLRRWRRGVQQAPHKPMLLLVVLDRVRRGLPRLVAFAELEEHLRPLLETFVGYRTEVAYPFWRLQADGLWEIPDAPQLPSRTANSDPSASTLRQRGVKGGLPVAYDDLLRRRSDILEAALDAVLQHLPAERHQELLMAVRWSSAVVQQRRAGRTPAADKRVFISYRRSDSDGWAGRLYDRLAGYYGQDRVFMDVDDIHPGQDFVDVVNDALDSSAVLLVVIGRAWAAATNARGQRRLDDPNDLVRLEIRRALDRDIGVIPLLVGSAEMPGREELPGELASLRRRNGMPIRHETFRSDTDRLLTTLDRLYLSPEAG